jgi:squalene-hopene/tetraprenyl-beta-curcumene cyclase
LDFSQRLQHALDLARKELLAARAPEGHWVGELSSSALSTATAVCALSIAEANNPAFRTPHSTLRVSKGLDWLAAHVNADGGWGDTPLSLSNISTTTLCWAAFGIVPGADEKYRSVVKGAERWLTERAGGITPEKLAPAIIARYGKDRTFSAPILTTCALSGRLGSGAEAWKWVVSLPFELAALPHQFFAALRLPVVSYALPALIAIGQVRHHHLPSRNPVARIARNLTRSRTLNALEKIQPSSGGFLEATPLTSFVVMSLAGGGQVNHPVTKKGVGFLAAAQRDDGSWPIDTNLATWVTTLSVNALASGRVGGSPAVSGDPPETFLTEGDRARIRDWLLKQQYSKERPYTHVAPGGWAWTDLPGGVPDADDTAGALLALKHLAGSYPNTDRGKIGTTPHPSSGHPLPLSDEGRGLGEGSLIGSDDVLRAAITGVKWLLDLQNSDGGIPTFCRGWTNLPFDRSAPDLTAHALRAWNAWLPDLPAKLQRRVRRTIERGVRYLERAQRPDGSWIPLWFGNQHMPDETNPAYGTAKVLLASAGLAPATATMLSRGVQWLLSAQKSDGSWSAPGNGPSSIEETALAIEALAAIAESGPATCRPSRTDGKNAVSASLALDPRQIRDAAMKGANWLIENVESGEWRQPSPIGFYFAKLWYYERLYPMIFTVAALERVACGFKTDAALPSG